VPAARHLRQFHKGWSNRALSLVPEDRRPERHEVMCAFLEHDAAIATSKSL
jgi:hypothetical protein